MQSSQKNMQKVVHLSKEDMQKKKSLHLLVEAGCIRNTVAYSNIFHINYKL